MKTEAEINERIEALNKAIDECPNKNERERYIARRNALEWVLKP